MKQFKEAIVDSIPVGLGYLSVSFAFGLLCVTQGLPLDVAVVMSLTNLTSAGQFSGLELILARASLFELAFSQLVINLRYLLMSFALSQKIDSKWTRLNRAFLSYGITDEIFALSMQKTGSISKFYFMGLLIIPVACWTLGTFLGGVAGNFLPEAVREALSFAIYGMFLAIFVPACKKNKGVMVVVLVSVICSCLCALSSLSSGIQVIVCTLLASVFGAFLFPIKEEEHE